MREWLFKRRLAKTRKFINELGNLPFLEGDPYLKSIANECLNHMTPFRCELGLKELVAIHGLGFIHKARRKVTK